MGKLAKREIAAAGKTQADALDSKQRRGTFRRIANRISGALVAGALALSLASCSPFEIRTKVNDGGNDAHITQEDARHDSGDSAEGGQKDAGLDTLPKWDIDRSYCREIVITGQFPQGYSHRIKLTPLNFNYANAKSDLGDLLAYEGTCASPDKVAGELGHWVEKANPSGESTIWVKTVNANAPVIALYYGNSAAVSSADIQKAFLFGDDFESGSLDTSVRWSVTDASTVTFSNGDMVFYSDSMNDKSVSSKTTFSAGKRLVATIKFEASDVSGSNVNYAGLGMGTGGDSGASPYYGKTIILTRTTSGSDITTALYVADMSQGQATATIAKPAGWISNQTYDSYELVWKQDNTIILKWGNQTATISSRTLSSYTLPVRIGGVYYNYAQRGTQTVSWVGVSELADPEPTYAVGSEQKK